MKNKCLVKVLFMLIIDIITYNKKGEFVKIHPFYYVCPAWARTRR